MSWRAVGFAAAVLAGQVAALKWRALQKERAVSIEWSVGVDALVTSEHEVIGFVEQAAAAVDHPGRVLLECEPPPIASRRHDDPVMLALLDRCRLVGADFSPWVGAFEKTLAEQPHWRSKIRAVGMRSGEPYFWLEPPTRISQGARE